MAQVAGLQGWRKIALGEECRRIVWHIDLHGVPRLPQAGRRGQGLWRAWERLLLGPKEGSRARDACPRARDRTPRAIASGGLEVGPYFGRRAVAFDEGTLRKLWNIGRFHATHAGKVAGRRDSLAQGPRAFLFRFRFRGAAAVAFQGNPPGDAREPDGRLLLPCGP